MQLFKKLGLMLLMLVMVAQAQQSAGDLYQAASKGDPAAFAQLKALGSKLKKGNDQRGPEVGELVNIQQSGVASRIDSELLAQPPVLSPGRGNHS